MTNNPHVAAAAHRLGVDQLYTPSEVAAMFRVDPKTVARWAKAGKLPFVRTFGGHRRYRSRDILPLLEYTGDLDE